MAYKYSIGQPFVYPQNDLDYASNFLRMCFAVPCEDYKVNPVLARAMDRIFILHADHEQNASTSTVAPRRFVGRQSLRLHRRRHRLPVGSGPWGRQRSGAEHAAPRSARSNASRNTSRRAKDKNDSFRLMGFGHRVYKNYDPRAKIMQKTCHEVLNELGIKDDPLLDVAMELERIALHDEYFIEKKLYPEHRLLFGHHPEGDGLPDHDVHRAVRGGPHRRLDRPVEGDDRGSAAEDRPAAPALHRRRRSATTCRSRAGVNSRRPRRRISRALLHLARSAPSVGPLDCGFHGSDELPSRADVEHRCRRPAGRARSIPP